MILPIRPNPRFAPVFFTIQEVQIELIFLSLPKCVFLYCYIPSKPYYCVREQQAIVYETSRATTYPKVNHFII